jgi:hypothetical protein
VTSTRRELISLLASTGAVSWPLAAKAQESVLSVIGFLNAASPNLFGHVVRAFQRGFKEVVMWRAKT